MLLSLRTSVDLETYGSGLGDPFVDSCVFFVDSSTFWIVRKPILIFVRRYHVPASLFENTLPIRDP